MNTNLGLKLSGMLILLLLLLTSPLLFGALGVVLVALSVRKQT